jgi:hypothetical protein
MGTTILPLLMSYSSGMQASTSLLVMSRPLSHWIEMASAAFESIQTPTRRVRNVLFWSCGLATEVQGRQLTSGLGFSAASSDLNGMTARLTVRWKDSSSSCISYLSAFIANASHPLDILDNSSITCLAGRDSRECFSLVRAFSSPSRRQRTLLLSILTKRHEGCRRHRHSRRW